MHTIESVDVALSEQSVSGSLDDATPCFVSNASLVSLQSILIQQLQGSWEKVPVHQTGKCAYLPFRLERRWAVFLHDGLFQVPSGSPARYCAVLDAWGAGYVELINACSDLIWPIWIALGDYQIPADLNWPEVLEYEVIKALGVSFGDSIIQCGSLPKELRLRCELHLQLSRYFGEALIWR